MIRIKKGLEADYIVFVFFICSIVAWFLEMLYSLIFRFVFVIPGSLYGPWCPIYGVAALFLLLFINKDVKKSKVFLEMFFLTSIIEYLGSIITDRLFNITFWDYSDFMFNINGRICLLMTLVFTFMSVIFLYFSEPKLEKIYYKNRDAIYNSNKVLLIIFMIDLFIKLYMTG